MKLLKVITLFCLCFGCSKSNKDHVAIGTWNRCNKDGSYFEYKITNQYLIMMTTRSDDIWLFRNEVSDSVMMLSEFINGSNLLINNDTFITIKQSKDRVVLKSSYTWDKLELFKAEFDYDEIDSTNLESWKTKTLSEFKKRVDAKNCPDLRTDAEKRPVIGVLNLDEVEEIEIDIDSIEN